ncbi:MAG: diguanylate cyclase [Candidatus Aminicenantales bacterium]
MIEKRKKQKKSPSIRLSALNSIIDNAPVGVYRTTLDGEFIYANPSLARMLGYSSPEEILKDKVISLYECKEERARLINLLKKHKKVDNFEVDVRTKKGESKKILLSATLEGREISGMVIDITETAKAKKRIEEMSHQIQKFSEIAADLLTIEDEKELFTRISKAVVDISDFNRVLISYFKDEPPYREIIGHRGIRKKDLERVRNVEMPREKYLSYFKKGIKLGTQSCYIPHNLCHILDQKAVIYGDKLYPEKNGSWHREDNLLVALKDAGGQVIGMISVDDSKSGLAPTEETVRPLEIFANIISSHIQRRILARRIIESEEKYRELVSNLKVGIVRATPQGELLEVNPAGVEMFGYLNAEDFLSRKGKDLFYNQEDIKKYVKEIEEKGMMKNKEFIFKKKNGMPFWVSMTATAVQDKSGRIKYYDTVIEDITERKKLEEEVKRLSITDELTGLYNRRYFNQNLPREIKRAARWKSSISLIMIDIDDFKKFNDHYHHLKGDKILIEIARVISSNIRSDVDWASRFGGEEFAIVLPGTDIGEAFYMAERIRKIFNSIEFKPGKESVYKTISLGIARCSFSEEKEAKVGEIDYEKYATELISLADRALFKAKHLGKNKVVISNNSLQFFPLN